METIDVFVRLEALSYDLRGLFTEIVKRNIDVLQSFIGFEAPSHSLNASHVTTIT